MSCRGTLASGREGELSRLTRIMDACRAIQCDFKISPKADIRVTLESADDWALAAKHEG